MQNKVICLFIEENQIVDLKRIFPEMNFLIIENLLQLYKEAIEGFAFFLIDHKNRMTKKIEGIDVFINSFNGYNSFGIQYLSPENKKDFCFLQYLPLRRFTIAEFKELKPWNILNSETRRYLRLNSKVPVEIIRSGLYTTTFKTYAEDVSIRGMKIMGDFYKSETIKIKSPLIPDTVFEGVVKWNVPWGQLESIPFAGIEINHDAKSSSYKALLKSLKDNLIPFKINF